MVKLEDVVEIRQSADQQAVNAALKQGFVILRIFNVKVRASEYGDSVSLITYVLGKIEEDFLPKKKGKIC